MEKWFKRKFQITLELTPIIICFCNYAGAHQEVVNVVILITKQYIYAQKCKEAHTTFMGALTRIIL